MKRYRLSPEAQQDLNDIKAYYLSGVGVRVARHVTGEITRAFEFLAGRPGAGRAAQISSDAGRRNDKISD